MGAAQMRHRACKLSVAKVINSLLHKGYDGDEYCDVLCSTRSVRY